ncbi:MAG: hypothetical protein AAF290_16815 [Pseudomonadota bacterium]
MTIKQVFLATAALLVAACGSSGRDVQEPNQPPTISAIADVAVTANQTSPAIAFTVNDEQPDNLSVDVLSANPQVVPDDGLILGGSGTARQLTVAPEIDMVGDAFVTVTVTDAAGLTADSTFLLTVDPERKSIQQFTRTSFAVDADGEPELVNAVEFDQDADGDDFADLLTQ